MKDAKIPVRMHDIGGGTAIFGRRFWKKEEGLSVCACSKSTVLDLARSPISLLLVTHC